MNVLLWRERVGRVVLTLRGRHAECRFPHGAWPEGARGGRGLCRPDGRKAVRGAGRVRCARWRQTSSGSSPSVRVCDVYRTERLLSASLCLCRALRQAATGPGAGRQRHPADFTGSMATCVPGGRAGPS